MIRALLMRVDSPFVSVSLFVSVFVLFFFVVFFSPDLRGGGVGER